jgi:dienelactone hydrolase
MRCRYWCSALLVVLAAGCGGKHALPLDVHAKTISQSARVTLQQISFRGYRGKRVQGYLALSRGSGRHPAVLWLHGSGGSDRDFLFSAAKWANSGGVGLTISQPNDATSFDPLIVNAEHALDLLRARKDVSDVAIAGLSLGAETAAIVAGDEKQLHVVALESGRGRSDVVLAVKKSKADFYVQVGLRDQVIPRPQLQALIGAIRGHVKVRWYDLPHVLDQKAYNDQLAWLAARLHLGRSAPAVRHSQMGA